ncbi:serine/arginine repetitive matrix protein 1 [Anguilla rostrata]|uniref:serine/arginine repetitive matrix protein 1 n=1 Tax=Anguilla rostrata TaxID=7938 RepID=UPI0030CBE100
MIRQKQKREILAKLGMGHYEEPLTLQGKNMMTTLSGQNLRPSSKNGWDSKAPGHHLSPGCRENTAAQLTAAGPPLESAPRRDPSPRDRQRERENLPPPRRPLKLAPLELPKEVRESQRRKIRGVQQEAAAAARKMDAPGNEPCPRKARTGTGGGRARSPERRPSGPLREPVEREAPSPAKAQAPVAQVRSAGLLRAAGVARGDGPRGPTALPSKPALPPGPDARVRAARAGEVAAGNPGTFQDVGRRRLRLRRAQGVDEDQGRLSVSMTCGLSAGEGREGDGKEGQRAEKALSEAGRALDKASRRHTRPLRHMGNVELSGKPSKRMAVGSNQDGAL